MNRLITGSRADMPMPAAVVARMRLERDMALAGESAALDEVARLEALATEQDETILTFQYRVIRLRELLWELRHGTSWVSLTEEMRQRIRAALEE